MKHYIRNSIGKLLSKLLVKYYLVVSKIYFCKLNPSKYEIDSHIANDQSVFFPSDVSNVYRQSTFMLYWCKTQNVIKFFKFGLDVVMVFTSNIFTL